MPICPLCGSLENHKERTLNSIDLLKCRTCHFIFASLPKDRILKVNSYYSQKQIQSYSLNQTSLDTIWFRLIAERFNKQLGTGKVLDVGCGNGKLLREFQLLNWDCWGIDPSAWSKDSAERYGYHLIPGTIEETPASIGEFDLVISSSTLEHIPEPCGHIENILKRVKPGGIAYFCGIPNYGSGSIKLGISRFYMNNPPGHVNYFTRTTMNKLMEQYRHLMTSFSIHTYGIPGIHFWYNKFVRNVIRLFSPREQSKDTSIPSIYKHSSSDNQASSAAASNPKIIKKDKKRFLNRFAVKLFYYIGRCFFAGDKIEVTIRK